MAALRKGPILALCTSAVLAFVGAAGVNAQESSAPEVSEPADVETIVAAAMDCFRAANEDQIDASVLRNNGWYEVLDEDGQPLAPGGQLFHKQGLSIELAVIADNRCSIIAPVQSPEAVWDTLRDLGTALQPDQYLTVRHGIALIKGTRSALFFIGPATNRTPTSVRIDLYFSERN